MILGACDPEILVVSESWHQVASGSQRTWCDQDPGILLSWACKSPWEGSSSGCCGTGCRVCFQGLLREVAQTHWEEPSHWSGGVPAYLGPPGPSKSQCWDRCCVFTSEPMILVMLEYMRLELPLGVFGLAVKFAPKVCSGHQPRQTGRNLCHWSGRAPVPGSH